MSPAEKMAREALVAWEKAASAYSETMVRDPRTLELGATFLRMGLQWKKSVDELVAAALPGAKR